MTGQLKNYNSALSSSIQDVWEVDRQPLLGTPTYYLEKFLQKTT